MEVRVAEQQQTTPKSNASCDRDRAQSAKNPGHDLGRGCFKRTNPEPATEGEDSDYDDRDNDEKSSHLHNRPNASVCAVMDEALPFGLKNAALLIFLQTLRRFRLQLSTR